MTLENSIPPVAAPPPEPEIRPKTFGDIMVGLFKIYFRGFFKFAIPLGLTLFCLIFALNKSREFSFREGWHVNIGPMLAIFFGYMIIYQFVYAGLLHTTASYEVNNKHNIGHSLVSLWRRFARILGVIGLTIVIGIALGLVLALFFIVPLLGAIVLVILFPFILYFTIKWSFVFPVVVIEGAAPTKAFSRSWELVTDNWWRVFGIILVIGLITGVLSWLLEFVFGFAGQYSMLISAAIAGPLSIISLTLLYYDLRARNEHCTISKASTELDPTIKTAAPAA